MKHYCFQCVGYMSLCYNDPEIYFLFPMIELLDGQGIGQGTGYDILQSQFKKLKPRMNGKEIIFLWV